MKRDKTDSAALLDLAERMDTNLNNGNKCEYRKISVTVPQWIYQRLVNESARRKIAGEPNRLLSALLREALMDYMAKVRTQSS